MLTQLIRDDFIDIMYQDGRCGLFHLGMARRRILLQDGDPVFRITTEVSAQGIEAIGVDRHGLIDRIDSHLSSYAAQLRNPSAVGSHPVRGCMGTCPPMRSAHLHQGR